MRRLSSLVVVVMVTALVSCGGDESDAEAFCDRADELSEDLQDLDPSDPSVLEQTSESLDELASEAPDEVQDDTEVLADAFGDFADAFADADPSDPAAALAAAQALFAEHSGEDLDDAIGNLEDFAQDECDVEIESGDVSFADLQAQLGDVELPDDSGEGDDGEAEEEGDGDTGGALPDPSEPPETSDPELGTLIEGCEAGDMQACDDLFNNSEIGSPEEEYGNTCGGRVPDPEAQFCVDIFPG